jgi:hypothetical protein
MESEIILGPPIDIGEKEVAQADWSACGRAHGVQHSAFAPEG